MTGMLASVSSVAEADIALQGGADIIDCKNPQDGALGALPAETIGQVVGRVDGRRLTSATTGNLGAAIRSFREAIFRTADCGVDYVKFGVFSEEAARAQIDALRSIAPQHDLIAVCFVDRYAPDALLPRLADCGVKGVMVDTANKTGPGLTAFWSRERTGRFVRAVHEHGLICGLAGRLRVADIAELLTLNADYLGFRSALCGGERRNAIDHACVMQVRGMVPFRRNPPPSAHQGMRLY